jgi:glycosyltransferase involved in cell wall biosynthesis
VPRVAIDATALLDVRTGVGAFVEAVVGHVSRDESIELVAMGFTRIYLGDLVRKLPANVARIRWPIPARTTRLVWTRFDHPTIERWTGPIDVVHGPNFVVPPAKHATELVTVHDLTPVRFPELCDANTIQYPGLIRRAVRRGAHVHTVSQFVADEVIAEFEVDADRVHVVPNGVDQIDKGDPARGRELAGGSPYVLSVGTVEPRKNLPLLVRAFDELAGSHPDVRLVIAGRDGWGRAVAELTHSIGSARHGDRVVRLGYVDDGARADLLAGADVLAYPSL